MKKALILFIGIGLVLSCSKDTVVDDEPTTPTEYMVSLGFSGEITEISESPLRSTESNDLYGIQVYAVPNNGSSDYKPYAYGLFDDKSLMTIKLLEGYKYKFVSSMVVDGKNRLLFSRDGYLSPFVTTDVTSLNNTFNFSSSKEMEILSYGQTNLKSFSLEFQRPNIDRYYGQVEGYIPSDNSSVSINMKRVVFGVKVEVEGVSEGQVKISLSEAPDLHIEYPETEIQDIFTFQNNYSYPLSWTKDDYSETITLSFTWLKVDGAEVPVATQDVVFKRNMLTTIRVKVNDALVDKSLTITTESTEMGDGGTFDVEGDGGTDTPIDPNP
jgi:hypothetical protein